jgi:NAD(P)H-flavin reductase
VILLYGNRVAEQIVYKNELDQLARGKNSQIIHILSEPPRGRKGLTGLVGRDTIEKVFAFDGAREWLYLVCGPPAMLDTVEEALIALGVPAGQIVSERFYYD